MNIGIPKEIKIEEHRVSLPPSAAREFVLRGHTVFVERGAGLSSGFTDNEYMSAGATIMDSADAVWSDAELIIKVKEPQASEYRHLRPDLILFTYLHLAADQVLTFAMLDSGAIGIAYETVEDGQGRLPLLEPMSEVAGRMAAQAVSHYLERHQGGRGMLMGGVPGVAPAHVVILGAGTVGASAAKIALGMGARVTLLDINLDRLRYLEDVLAGKLTTLYSNSINISRAIQRADALIGAVLITGARAPMLVTRDMLPAMPEGSIIVDVAVDQGGCVESTRPTTHSDPTFEIDGVLHYGVPNMPGAVPRTSSLALANATLPYALKIADLGLHDAMRGDPALQKGLNTIAGRCTHPAVAETFSLDFDQPLLALDLLTTPAPLPL
ncbi:MAG: alanine dehydrogenase [Chloroflexi bacterium]|nr:alanine dehydrogenase [Chloroflexota bacterium]